MQASLARKPRGMDAGLCTQKLDITSKTAFIAKGRPVVEQWGAPEGRLLVVHYRGRRDKKKPKQGVINFCTDTYLVSILNTVKKLYK
jgi:hypothetical protein